jgi:hypothetical protein
MLRAKRERTGAFWKPALRVGGIFALCLVALVAAWPRISGPYAAAIEQVVRPTLHAIEATDPTVVHRNGDEIWVFRQVGEGRVTPVVWFDRYAFFAIVPLLALLMATPGLGLRGRALRTVGALTALFLFHVTYIVASVELLYAASWTRSLGGVQLMVRVLWEAAPVAIWIAFTAGTWRLRFTRWMAGSKACCSASAPIGAGG